MLSVRALVYFVSTLETGSLTATARKYAVSVSTVSASVANLEDALGYQLFLRTPGRLLATQAGAATEAPARAILAGLATIEAEQAAATTGDVTPREKPHLSLLILIRFIASYEAGSVGAAASALHITQPQISRQIAELERLLGQPLFKRTSRGLTPTPWADRLYDQARPVCDIALGLVGRGNRLFAENERSTNIGSVPPFHPSSQLAGLLANLQANWRGSGNGSALKLVTEKTDKLLALVADGSLHAAIVEASNIPEEFESQWLMEARLELLAYDRQGIADPRLLLETMPLALQGRASALRQMTDQWMAAHGVEPEHIVEIEAMPIIDRLVREHGYCSIVPAGAIPTDGTGLRRFDLPGSPVMTQRLVWRRQLGATATVRRLRDLLAGSA